MKNNRVWEEIVSAYTNRPFWKLHINGYEAVIREDGKMFIATSYKCFGGERELDFVFPKKRTLKAMQAMIEKNAHYIEPKVTLSKNIEPTRDSVGKSIETWQERHEDKEYGEA